MMIVEEPQQDAEAKKQIYLQRINQLYTDINHWLQDEPLVLENGELMSMVGWIEDLSSTC
jgi:hypothetical protein